MRRPGPAPAPPTPVQLEATAVEVARAAAALIRAEVGRALGVGSKSSPTDVVTQTDIDAETLMRKLIAEATPEASILGEEGGDTTPGGRVQWIIDPLDGTVNFLYGLPVVGVSAAVAVDGGIVAGAVVDVGRDEAFSAALGHGARVDGQPIAVAPCNELGSALVMTGFSYRASVRERQGAIVHRLVPLARDIRCFGSAALALCWVGAGRGDAYFERDIKVWDYSAGALVAAEAGARIELPCPENDGLVVAGGPAVFDALREQVRQDR